MIAGSPIGPRLRFDRLRRYAPLPFVAVAVLLVVLILITPVLISSGQPAPGILTQAELVVDRLSYNDTMHFYVHGLSTTVRYSSIWFGITGRFNWSATGPVPWRTINWTGATWSNHSDVLLASMTSVQNPVAVNITAYYVSTSGTAWYGGVVAFYVAPSSGGYTLYGSGESSAVAVPGSTPVDNSSLPLPITLPLVSPGGPP
jgi:hypothetical protein